jgi:copper chaperone CopZ
MTNKIFIVPNINCGHCTRAIETELGELPGVTRVKADQSTKKVTVEWEEPATWDKIRALLEEINYPPENE